MMVRFGLVALAASAFGLTLLSTAHAQPKPKPKQRLSIVVKLAEPVKVSGRFEFDSKASQVRLLPNDGALKTFFTAKNCAPGKAGARRCYIIDIKTRDPEKPCLAVLLDTERLSVSWKDFKIGQADTEDGAIRDAFIGSGIYDELYALKRLIYPLAPPIMIDEAIYTKETDWLTRLLVSACP